MAICNDIRWLSSENFILFLPSVWEDLKAKTWCSYYPRRQGNKKTTQKVWRILKEFQINSTYMKHRYVNKGDVSMSNTGQTFILNITQHYAYIWTIQFLSCHHVPFPYQWPSCLKLKPWDKRMYRNTFKCIKTSKIT